MRKKYIESVPVKAELNFSQTVFCIPSSPFQFPVTEEDCFENILIVLFILIVTIPGVRQGRRKKLLKI